MSNGYGDVYIDRYTDMAAHDACPPVLRRAVCYAVTKYSSVHKLNQWLSGCPARVMLRSMIRRDREHTLIAYGPTHPEAPQGWGKP